MELTAEEAEILEGRRGKTLQKCMQVLKSYGEIYGADRFVECKSCHFVTSCGIRFVKTMFSIMTELKDAGLRCKCPLTANPRPTDPAYPLVERIAGWVVYGKQGLLEQLLLDLGLISPDAFTCTPYYVGNKPGYGEVIVWAESSAVIYANSVLGARTNRNSSMVELISGILGLTPRFGLLVDENRRANWLVEIKTSERPNPFVLGSLIGKCVMDGVPYIVGLDRWEYAEYELKDMGAAAAVWGAVGLFHAEGLTPEAEEHGRGMLSSTYRRLVVDDERLKKMREEMGQPSGMPDLAVIGCPHLSYEQLERWAELLAGHRVRVETWLLAAPALVRRFKQTKLYGRLRDSGVKVLSVCPLMFTNIPTSKRLRIVTNSAKLSYYSHAQYADDEKILSIILGEEVRR